MPPRPHPPLPHAWHLPLLRHLPLALEADTTHGLPTSAIAHVLYGSGRLLRKMLYEPYRGYPLRVLKAVTMPLSFELQRFVSDAIRHFELETHARTHS